MTDRPDPNANPNPSNWVHAILYYVIVGSTLICAGMVHKSGVSRETAPFVAAGIVGAVVGGIVGLFVATRGWAIIGFLVLGAALGCGLVAARIGMDSWFASIGR